MNPREIMVKRTGREHKLIKKIKLNHKHNQLVQKNTGKEGKWL